MQKIGLSVSMCIKDILEGIVEEEDVLCIIDSTCALRAKQLEKYYCSTYWAKDPTEGAAILHRMFYKIYQPRLRGNEPPVYTAGKHWLTVE